MIEAHDLCLYYEALDSCKCGSKMERYISMFFVQQRTFFVKNMYVCGQYILENVAAMFEITLHYYFPVCLRIFGPKKTLVNLEFLIYT